MSGKRPIDLTAAIHVQAPVAAAVPAARHGENDSTGSQYYNARVEVPAAEATESIEMENNRPEINPLQENDAEPSKTKSKRKRKLRRDNDVDDDAIPKDQQMQYSINDVPPWYLLIILGFQHYLIMFGATVANPLVMSKFLCIGDDNNVAKSELIGTIVFVSGICTLLQVTFGVRLPIVQGGTFTFVTPSIAILSLDKWKCPAIEDTSFSTDFNVTTIRPIFENSTQSSAANLDADEIWKSRIREIQGAIILASIVQVVIGFTGIMGFMLRFIGPLAIAPTIALAGLALFEVASGFAGKQWWITLVTIVLIAAFSQYTRNVEIPCFHFERGVGCVKQGFPLLRLFPIILAIVITWGICAILTATNVFPSDPEAWGSGAATNLRLDVLEKAPWFRFPYPGQWGLPTVSTASVLGMMSGVLTSMVESVGDYYACARISQAPPPPIHAINRGIGIEGIGCILAGAWGSGSGTTSYSENIGAIGITKVSSIRVIQTGAFFMLIFGVFTKFGAIFVTIPDPIVGGVFIVMFGMITAVGISNLQFVDLNSSRNLFIIGFSFFFGLTLPQYIAKNPNSIETGVVALDQTVTVLLRTSMFVGGLAGFILDNTIPGTDAERGLIKWRQMLHVTAKDETATAEEAEERREARIRDIYDLPFVTGYLRRFRWTRFIPFLPTFDEDILSFRRCTKRNKYRMKSSSNSRGEACASNEDVV